MNWVTYCLQYKSTVDKLLNPFMPSDIVKQRRTRPEGCFNSPLFWFFSVCSSEKKSKLSKNLKVLEKLPHCSRNRQIRYNDLDDFIIKFR